MGVMPRKLPTFHHTSFPLILPSGSRDLWSESGQRESLVLGHASPGLVEDSSHSFDSVTPAPLRLHPRVAGPAEDRTQAGAQVCSHPSKGGETPN